MPNPWMIVGALVASILAALGGFFYGQHTAGVACDARVSALVISYDAARDKAVSEARARHEAEAASFAASDQKRTKELTDARSENDALRADVADGRKRLLVRARCPAPAGLPEGRSGAGLDDAASPRLVGAAEQDYFTLVERVQLMEAQLLGLQDRERVRGGGQ